MILAFFIPFYRHINNIMSEAESEGNYYYHQLSIKQKRINEINETYPHCGTLFLVLYNDSRRIMVGKTENKPIENEINSKINKELLNQGLIPNDIIVFPFSKENITKLMERFPNSPTVSQFDQYVQKKFTESVYQRCPVENHHGLYIEHFGRKDNYPIDAWQLRSLFMGLGFDWNYQSYWYLEKDRDFTVTSELIF